MPSIQIYGEQLADRTKKYDRPCMVGHTRPDGGFWVFWPADYGEYVPDFSDTYGTQDEAEKAAEEWCSYGDWE